MNFHVKFDKFTFPLLLSYQQSPDIKGFYTTSTEIWIYL